MRGAVGMRKDAPEGVSGAGGGGEVLELGGHGLDEGNGKALLQNEEDGETFILCLSESSHISCARKMMIG